MSWIHLVPVATHFQDCPSHVTTRKIHPTPHSYITSHTHALGNLPHVISHLPGRVGGQLLSASGPPEPCLSVSLNSYLPMSCNKGHTHVMSVPEDGVWLVLMQCLALRWVSCHLFDQGCALIGVPSSPCLSEWMAGCETVMLLEGVGD